MGCLSKPKKDKSYRTGEKSRVEVKLNESRVLMGSEQSMAMRKAPVR